MSPEEEAKQTLGRLAADLGSGTAWRFVIPGWDPVGRPEAERWVRSMIYEGFYVAFRVNRTNQTVLLKYWEYGDDEPAWRNEPAT